MPTQLNQITSFGWIGENREMKVFLKDGQWHTRHFIDGQPDQSLIKIYGTHEIPTPWSEETDQETVISELAMRNQHAMVSGS